MIDFETKKVLFIDLDGTLIKTISGKTFPEDITDFRVQLPVLDKIIEKMPNLNMFFIVSNQGGLKTLTDKRIFNYKIWAVEGICHGYFINKLNNFSYSDSLYCCSMIRVILIENLILECQNNYTINTKQSLKMNVL